MKKIKIAKVFIIICEVLLIVGTVTLFLTSLISGIFSIEIFKSINNVSGANEIIFGVGTFSLSFCFFLGGLVSGAKLFLNSIVWYKVNKWKSKKDITTAFVLSYVCVGLSTLLCLVPAIILSTINRNDLNI
mgnify:CR=1 FL=1